MAELSSKDMTTKFTKLEKFQGNNFRRWQKEDAFFADHSESRLCVEHSDAGDHGRRNARNHSMKVQMGERRLHLQRTHP